MIPCELASSTADSDSDVLVRALTESRERWRTLLQDHADLAFETDAAGRFVLLAPDPALGWPAERLVGTPAASLLFRAAGAPADIAFDPFRGTEPVRGRRVWLRDAAGTPVCLLVNAAPIAGKTGAMRGLGVDVTEQEQQDEAVTAALRSHESVRAIAFEMRRAAHPLSNLRIGLAELVRIVKGDGASVLLHEGDQRLRIAAVAGQPWPGGPETLQDEVRASCDQPSSWLVETHRRTVCCDRSLLLCASTNHFVESTILAVWRHGADWSEAEADTAAALLQTMQPILEHDQIQRETARLSRTDILTGLFNRQGFIAEVPRRIERLDREGHPAALMVVGLDKLAGLNEAISLERGDAALRQAAALLRDLVRPTDLVARLGGDLFTVWLDNADQFTAAERADHLVRAGIRVEDGSGVRSTISVGIAMRESRSFESLDSLLHRAWNAMLITKSRGGGRWRVSNEAANP